MRLSERLEAVTESKTVQFTSLLARRAAKGASIINMAVGEPEHETPLSVVAATKQALDEGKTRYSPVQGIKALKSRLSEQIENFDEENIIVCNGSKQALYAIFQTLCNPLDEVIIPRPYWVSFSEQVKLASAVPVFVDTVAHQLDCRAVSEAVTDRTRAIIINSPNNPTGSYLSREDLVRILEASNGLIVLDEAYVHFAPESQVSLLQDYEKLILLQTFSKAMGAAALRFGYSLASPALTSQLNKVHLPYSINAFTLVAVEVLIDVGTADLDAFRHALLIADRVLIPVTPSQADIWSTQRFVQFLYKVTEGDAPESLAFINRADVNRTIPASDEAAAALTSLPGIRLISQRVSDRPIFRDSFSEGLAVFELEPRSRAAVEFKALASAVFGEKRSFGRRRPRRGRARAVAAAMQRRALAELYGNDGGADLGALPDSPDTDEQASNDASQRWAGEQEEGVRAKKHTGGKKHSKDHKAKRKGSGKKAKKGKEGKKAKKAKKHKKGKHG